MKVPHLAGRVRYFHVLAVLIVNSSVGSRLLVCVCHCDLRFFYTNRNYSGCLSRMGIVVTSFRKILLLAHFRSSIFAPGQFYIFVPKAFAFIEPAYRAFARA